MCINIKEVEICQGRYLVTGAAGQMGTFALMRLRNLPNIYVRAVYHKKKPNIFADNISYIQADLRNPDDCKKIVDGIDYVLMFAGILSTAPVMARNPVSHITENMIMNAQMLEVSYFAGVKKFLWLSSTTGYPVLDKELVEEDMFCEDPPDTYFSVGWMSRYTEILCRMYATKLKNPITTVILKPTTIYSEYEDFCFATAHVLPATVRKVVERQNPLEIWGTGDNRRDFIYADDVLDACLLALERVNSFDVFNIGYGKDYSVNEILKIILELDDYMDAQIVYNTSKPSAIGKRNINCTKAKKILGFKAKTTIEEGVCKMIEWYKKNPVVDGKKFENLKV